MHPLRSRLSSKEELPMGDKSPKNKEKRKKKKEQPKKSVTQNTATKA